MNQRSCYGAKSNTRRGDVGNTSERGNMQTFFDHENTSSPCSKDVEVLLL